MHSYRLSSYSHTDDRAAVAAIYAAANRKGDGRQAELAPDTSAAVALAERLQALHLGQVEAGESSVRITIGVDTSNVGDDDEAAQEIADQIAAHASNAATEWEWTGNSDTSGDGDTTSDILVTITLPDTIE